MGVTAKEYVGMLKELLPPGPAWPRGDSASLYALMFEVWGAELARVDARARALVTEADPRVAIETFPEWLDEWVCRMSAFWLGQKPTTRRYENFCFGRLRLSDP